MIQIVNGTAFLFATNSAIHNPFFQGFKRDIEVNHTPELMTVRREEVFERLCLFKGAGVTIEQHVMGFILQPRKNESIDEIVVHESSFSHVGFDPKANLCPFRDSISENITRGYMYQGKFLSKTFGNSALPTSGRAQEDIGFHVKLLEIGKIHHEDTEGTGNNTRGKEGTNKLKRRTFSLMGENSLSVSPW